MAGFSCPSLTVWQLFVAEQMGNKYLIGGDPTMDDAAGLIVVATSTREELRNLFVSPRAFLKKLARVSRKLSCVPFEKVDVAMRDYLRSCLRTPEHKHPTDASGAPAAAPYQWHIVLCLCSHYGMTPDTAWEMPYAEARCLFDTWSESQGSKTLADARLQKTIDEWVERGEASNG